MFSELSNFFRVSLLITRFVTFMLYIIQKVLVNFGPTQKTGKYASAHCFSSSCFFVIISVWKLGNHHKSCLIVTSCISFIRMIYMAFYYNMHVQYSSGYFVIPMLECLRLFSLSLPYSFTLFHYCWKLYLYYLRDFNVFIYN